MDVMRVIKYFTYDVVFSVGYNRPFGHLDASEDIYRVIKVMEVLVPLAMMTL